MRRVVDVKTCKERLVFFACFFCMAVSFRIYLRAFFRTGEYKFRLHNSPKGDFFFSPPQSGVLLKMARHFFVAYELRRQACVGLEWLRCLSLEEAHVYRPVNRV